MTAPLPSYLRQRALQLGLSMSELGRRANLSRQTLYALNDVPDKWPALQTIVSLAQVLEVHPIRLLQALFESAPLARPVRIAKADLRDRSAFVADVTLPDGAVVLTEQAFVKTWKIQNTGEVPWIGRWLQCMDDEVVVYTRSGEVLHVADSLQPTASRIRVPDTAPGEVVELHAEFTAPSTPGTVLSYWKMAFDDGTLCYPEAKGLWVKVRVCSLASGASVSRK